uniref:PID domain-containing protein n=1 Tax=Ascaris lumbricoides TaxID=6252 RepID=A0A0M3IBJ2_ASCLU
LATKQRACHYFYAINKSAIQSLNSQIIVVIEDVSRIKASAISRKEHENRCRHHYICDVTSVKGAEIFRRFIMQCHSPIGNICQDENEL